MCIPLVPWDSKAIFWFSRYTKPAIYGVVFRLYGIGITKLLFPEWKKKR